MIVTGPDRHARSLIIPAMLLSLIWGVAGCTPNKTNPRTRPRLALVADADEDLGSDSCRST